MKGKPLLLIRLDSIWVDVEVLDLFAEPLETGSRILVPFD